MPSYTHELLLNLFRECAGSAADLLRKLNVPLPEYEWIRTESSDINDLQPAEYRADLVLLLLRESQSVLGIIVEVQLGRDDAKSYAWPAYVANLRARHRCPVCLLVITTENSVARWAGKSIELGPGTQCTPWVVGPSNAPVVTELRTAQENVELAVLSAVEHMRSSDTELAARIVAVARDAAARLDDERSKLYLDLIHVELGSAGKALQEVMNSLGFEYQSEFARRYVAEGRVEGRKEGRQAVVLKQLACRFGPLPESIQTRVRGAPEAQLDNVAERLLTARTLEEALGSLD